MGKLKRLVSVIFMTCMIFALTCTASASTLNTTKAGKVTSASCTGDSMGRLTAHWGAVSQVRAAQINGYYLVQVYCGSSRVYETRGNYLDTYKLCCSMTKSTSAKRYPYYAVITPYVKVNGVQYYGLGKTASSIYRY